MQTLLGIANLDDLADYYDNESIKSAIREKTKTSLQKHKDKSIILIGHSMGSIIAHDVLRELSSDPSNSVVVDHLITIGSPLGLSKVKYEVKREFGKAAKPENTLLWSNLSDPGDKVALDCRLDDDYGNNDGRTVNDILVKNTYRDSDGKSNNHKSYGYLRTPEFSELLYEILD